MSKNILATSFVLLLGFVFTSCSSKDSNQNETMNLTDTTKQEKPSQEAPDTRQTQKSLIERFEGETEVLELMSKISRLPSDQVFILDEILEINCELESINQSCNIKEKL